MAKHRVLSGAVSVNEEPALQVDDTFSEAERVELSAFRYAVDDEKSLGVLDLLVAWALHVRKIGADRAKPASDRDVWGAHDLVAAMFLRSFLAVCLEELPQPLHGKVAEQVARHDERFKSMTRPDDERLLEQVAGEDLSAKPWWWHRVPDSGPIAEELRG
ncbi:hypothetical protein SAMN04489727_4054 [Amycolatopsis tolypomycina]|uniref:Uncharacterized protein n=1 Tax=Amycolatopsis tolypomycina TaxID=208445 RepID=A0A1H4T7L5_9PSEU|nr:hypothetical protein SAMN04489727_4054 [Amycolatopsis tolypomycina]